MRISGLQKLTLLDYPGLLACTVFLPGCNLRCPFCHNADLVLPERMEPPQLTAEYLLEFLESRKGKLDGVCITGGEPTLHRDLPRLLETIKTMGFRIKLDTNGTNPQVLRQLLEANLPDYVAMDIKNSPDRYAETCGGVDVLEHIRESAALLMENGAEYEFRTTVCNPLHTPDDLASIGRWLAGAKQYYLQQFVQSSNLVGSGLTAPTKEEMEALRQAVLPYIPNTRLRGVS